MPISKVDDWFEKWGISEGEKLTIEDAKKAIEELEGLVEQYCQRK